MNPLTKKILAVIVALLVILFPFRRAFLSDELPGIMMMFSFLITLAGIVIFYFLTLNQSENKEG